MHIKELDREHFDSYKTICESDGSIFYSIEWLNVFGKNISIYGLFDKSNNLIGGFNIFRKRIFCFIYYRNPPFTPYIGPHYLLKANKYNTRLNFQKNVLHEIAYFLNKLKFSLLSISLDSRIVDTQPFIWKKYKVVPSYTYIITLAKNEKEMMEDMSVKRRNDINKALKDKILVKLNDGPANVRDLLIETLKSQKLNKYIYYLEKILQEFANDKNSFSCSSYLSERQVATVFCIYDKYTAYYLMGGYDKKNSHHGANAIALWECIKYSKKIGLRKFDFEGSMVPGIEKYFRGFGGEIVPYYRVNKARFFFEVLLKFYRRDLF